MGLHGLIQHSFAMRVPAKLHPLYAREGAHDQRRLLETIFAPRPVPGGPQFVLSDAGMEDERPDGDPARAPWRHSIILTHGQSRIVPFSAPYMDAGDPCNPELPRPFSWAKTMEPTGKEPSGAFAFGGDDKSDRERRNDFLVEEPMNPGDHGDGEKVARFLCQMLAHRRSQLFGLALARRISNVFLPHALLRSIDDSKAGDWLAQPVVGLFYVPARRGLRPIFSFSLFLVPCRNTPADGGPCGVAPRLDAREMCLKEIRDSVKTSWPLARAHELRSRPAFAVSGPLSEYLAASGSSTMECLRLRPSGTGWEQLPGGTRAELTLRKFTEATLFALAVQMTRGAGASLGERGRRELGDDVLTALSASRVSSVIVVDPDCAKPRRDEKCGDCGEPEPGRVLTKVSRKISSPRRIGGQTLGVPAHRIDRDLVDRPGYEIAVLAADRCTVVVGNCLEQRNPETSALLEAGWVAYMVMGAATATGLIRSIFRDISDSGRDEPKTISEIEREAMVDLHETYDIEITVEAYRHHYRQLRKRLGIKSEYEALRRKLEALYRETSTRYEERSERRLTMLTWGTAVLSAVIAIGTLVLIFKGG